MSTPPAQTSLTRTQLRRACISVLLALGLSASAQDRDPVRVPGDLLDEPHVREDLAINKFTAPSISKLFGQLDSLQPLPFKEVERRMPNRRPLDRADLALEIGFLIADGFLAVQAGNFARIETLSIYFSDYGKSLGAGERVDRHAAALREWANDGDISKLKDELAATQKDVETELFHLHDADLADLISLGGWIRALEIACTSVTTSYTPERASHLMHEDIADYYEYSVGSLEQRIRERPRFVRMRKILAGLRDKMTVDPDAEVTRDHVAAIRDASAELVALALERQR